MIYLLDFREKVRGIYSSYKEYCTLAYKFIMSLITFIVIDVKLGFDNEFINALSVLLFALVGTFIPSSLTVLLACLVSVACVFSYSPVLGFMLCILLVIVYCLFMRFVPKLGYAMLAIPIAYVLKIPVLVPIILGLVCTPIAVIPVMCGTIVYYFILAIKSVESVSNSVNKVEALQVFIYVMRKFTENKAIFVSIILFFVITIIVYMIRTRNIDHAYEIAIICAGIIYLFTYLVAAFNLDLGIGIIGIVFGAIISCAIAIIVQFFICVLDYSSVENVQFEDDDYIYFVKAIPKVKISSKNEDIKTITKKKSVAANGDGFDDDFDFDSIGKNIEKNLDFELDSNLTNININSEEFMEADNSDIDDLDKTVVISKDKKKSK